MKGFDKTNRTINFISGFTKPPWYEVIFPLYVTTPAKVGANCKRPPMKMGLDTPKQRAWLSGVGGRETAAKGFDLWNRQMRVLLAFIGRWYCAFLIFLQSQHNARKSYFDCSSLLSIISWMFLGRDTTQIPGESRQLGLKWPVSRSQWLNTRGTGQSWTTGPGSSTGEVLLLGAGALQGKACEWDLKDLKKKAALIFVFHFEITSKFSCLF